MLQLIACLNITHNDLLTRSSLNPIYFINLNTYMPNQYEVYKIGDAKNQYKIELTSNRTPSNSEYSQRKAYCDHSSLPQPSEIFYDKEFQIVLGKQDVDSQGHPLKLRRLYQLYDQDLELFDQKWSTETPALIQPFYPSVIAEFIMLDKEYVKTTLFTKTLTKQGYYQYFVRRNGQYYVDYVDDWIPVEGQEQLPIWGLTINEPWKLILLKAWIKEKGTLKAVRQAQPFEFIQAFGLPGYRALSIKKQIEYLKISTLTDKTKQSTVDKIPFHDDTYIVVGKTRDSQKVKQLGLVPNLAGYKIQTVRKENPLLSSLRQASSQLIDENIFRVKSSVPSRWTGKYSVLSHNFTSRQKQIKPFNIEYQFLASYEEVSEVFTKFYVVRKYKPDRNTSSKFIDYDDNIIEDSILLQITQRSPHYFFELTAEKQGLFNVNVQLPLSSQSVTREGSFVKKRYPPIKLLLARKNDKKNHPLESYEYYDGQYIKGYHKNLNRFVRLLPGNYYIFVKIDNTTETTDSFVINISSNAVISNFKQANELPPNQQSAILKSTLYNYVQKYGVKAYTEQVVKDRRLYLCNCLDTIGFGIVAVSVDSHSKFFIGVRVHCDPLVREYKMDLSKTVHGVNDKSELVFIDRGDDPQVIILEKFDRSQYAEKTFPPQGTFEFYEIEDNV